jgi:hypothetical protein
MPADVSLMALLLAHLADGFGTSLPTSLGRRRGVVVVDAAPTIATTEAATTTTSSTTTRGSVH